MTKKNIITKKTAQSLVEYGLIMVMVAVIAITVLQYRFGPTMSTVGTRIRNEVNVSSIQEYCNSIAAAQRAECTANIK